MEPLKLLSAGARSIITPAFLDGQSGLDVSKYVHDFHRPVDVEPMRWIVNEAMRRFRNEKPETSDGWLAPRVHATLRLTRREAADRALWAYIAVVEVPEYVRWRWGATLDRFIGTDVNQALSRLWWGAELVRNGDDYSMVETAFEAQDIPNTWFRLDAFHHRPTAIAAMRVMDGLRGGVELHGKRIKRTKRINMLSTAFNTALVTVSLDAVAPHAGEDAGAIAEWIADEVDETLMVDQPPTGPAEERVPEEALAAVDALLTRVGHAAGLLGVQEIEDDEDAA